MEGFTEPHFLGRLRHERLASNQMVGRSVDKKLCQEPQASHSFLIGPNWQSSFPGGYYPRITFNSSSD